jgi:hypothetical protein
MRKDIRSCFTGEKRHDTGATATATAAAPEKSQAHTHLQDGVEHDAEHGAHHCVDELPEPRERFQGQIDEAAQPIARAKVEAPPEYAHLPAFGRARARQGLDDLFGHAHDGADGVADRLERHKRGVIHAAQDVGEFLFMSGNRE